MSDIDLIICFKRFSHIQSHDPGKTAAVISRSAYPYIRPVQISRGVGATV